MKTFLGVGLGPIQTSIFLDGAFRGGFGRLVIADVDAALIQTVRDNNGTIQVYIATADAVTTETISGVEIYNPTVSEDLEKLTEAAAQADEVATALPSVAFFKHLGWMKAGFEKQLDRRRFVYAAENHNHAAEELEKVLGPFPKTYYLNTVIGKMCCVFPADECARRKVPTLTPLADRGHLVEAFNKILIQSCSGIEERRVQGLVENLSCFLSRRPSSTATTLSISGSVSTHNKRECGLCTNWRMTQRYFPWPGTPLLPKLVRRFAKSGRG